MTDTNKVDVEPVAQCVCPECGTHEISFTRLCHNSGCKNYATEIVVYEGWKAATLVPTSALAALQRENEDHIQQLRKEQLYVQSLADQLAEAQDKLDSSVHGHNQLFDMSKILEAERDAAQAESETMSRVMGLALAEAQADAARYRNALVGLMACTLRADCPPDIYDAAESALKGDV